MATNKVEVEIVATDEASPKIDKLEAKIHNLETDEARIVVTSNIDRLNTQLDAAQKKLNQLDGDEFTVQARLVGNLEQDLRQAEALFNQLDGKTGTVVMKLDDQEMRDGTRRATEGIDQISGSARGANSALANMVGNTAQDLGALGGFAGSAGVAIGQMAEYAADARLEGEALGSTLVSMAKVVGPILLLTTAVAAVSSVLGDQAQAAKESEERTKDFGEAMRESGDDALGFANVMRGNETSLRDFAAARNDALGGFGIAIDRLGEKVPLIGRFFDRTSVDVIQALGAANLSIYDMGAALDGTSQERQDFIHQLGEAASLGKINADQYHAIVEAVEEQSDEVLTATERQILYNVSLDEANAIIDNLLKHQNPLRYFRDQWRLLFDDFADGKLDAEGSAEAINFLAENLGITQEEVVNLVIAHDKETDALKRQKGPLDTAIRLTKEYIDAKRDLADEIRDQVEDGLRAAQAALDLAADFQAQIDKTIEMKTATHEAAMGLQELAEAQDDLEAGALAEALDLGDNRLDTLTTVQNINEEIRALAEFLKDPEGLAGKIPDIFDQNDVNASEFLDKIAGLRGPIQEEIARVFGESGATAAQAVAETFVETIAKQTGLSEGQVRGLLGVPEELSVLIKPVVDATDEAIARRMLAVLAGIPGQGLEALVIEMGLDNKEITPQQARLLAQEKLQDLEIPIPLALYVPDPDRAVRDAEAALAGHSVAIPVRFTVTADQMERAIQAGISLPGGSFGPTSTVNNTYIYPNGATPPVVAGAVTIDYNRNGSRQAT